MKFRRLAMMLAAAPLLVALPQAADAACAALSLCTCTATTTGVSFGNYDPTSPTANTTSGTIRVTCTLLLALSGSFTVDFSTGGSGVYTTRTLSNGGSGALRYNLFMDMGQNQIWGDGTGSSTHWTQSFAALLLVDISQPVYGAIPPQQNVPAGLYTDSIVATVTF